MAIRKIVTVGDKILKTPCREVKDITPRILELLDDMADTLYEADGAGLAAPQVGVLRRIAVVDVGDGLYELINPEIIEAHGEQSGSEGCLSYPGKYGLVKRPMRVKVRSLNRNGETIEFEGEGLTARAFCHEIDHLDGKMFMDLVSEWLDTDEETD